MHTPCGRATGKKTLQTTFLLIILFESFECRVASLITKRLARKERIYHVGMYTYVYDSSAQGLVYYATKLFTQSMVGYCIVFF